MDTDFEKMLSDRVTRLHSAHGVPSLTVAVAQREVCLGAVAMGFADIEHGIPASPDSVYRIGSITKTFTAALALQLVDQQCLDLNAPVGHYLRSTSFGQVPLRMLLAHCGGIQREVPGDLWESMQGPTKSELCEAFTRVEMVAEPGQRWHYSNLGYATVGAIIEYVAGRPCDELISETLLTPLGMSRTTWTPPSDAVVGYRIDPYIDVFHREPVLDRAATAVAGQLWSTPTDLLRWGNALIGAEPDVVPISVIDRMHTLQIMADPRAWTKGWGLGLILQRRPDRILAGHTGHTPGFHAALTIDRESGTVVVACTNATRGITLADVTADIADQAAVLHPPAPAPRWRPAPPCPEEVGEILGRWWSEAEETVFTWRHDGLHANLAADPDNTDTAFITDAPGCYLAVQGRFQGERLTVVRTASGTQLRWATYPFTRSPR
ncbi:beta-lactamase family protein [Nocardia terpenica]|uniref:serine hydrolase domain-containing protein n=1 Tax=Nocardia terpenica TaxID=455432 RepID=UPI00189383E2|nr:serine hydrolase domain-containing protein [Nocardia terpenica]MBF6063268.1 beta-lactamase family protein [Nocardia terpenica]MBF6105824.1 beta-lactamase family protein [Nocardia terpenica]MBF6113592.1 beta-lactamase family protein [Nocardia terpenica]MBF6119565.1 beta-lactamase family protein [Nocardia terpenica]MBF6151976.1 beta-lactamase family protein [Nocardia terpenica]